MPTRMQSPFAQTLTIILWKLGIRIGGVQMRLTDLQEMRPRMKGDCCRRVGRAHARPTDRGNTLAAPGGPRMRSTHPTPPPFCVCVPAVRVSSDDAPRNIAPAP